MRFKIFFIFFLLTYFSFNSFMLIAQEEEKTEETATELQETATEPQEKAEPEEKVEETEEKKEEEKKPADKKDVTETAIEGLDTVSVREPEGNWLLKRIWWEKAQKKYEKIKEIVSKIVDTKLPFFKKRNDVKVNVLDPFYLEIGLSQGQLKEVMADLDKEIKKERKEDIVLDKKELEVLETLNAEKKKIEQLNLDINGIKKIDVALGYDIQNLIQQINRSRRYEENAWQLFKGIAKELNHKKARELFYKMDALWKNVKGIISYINGAFLQHFDLLVESAKTQTERIKNIATDLKTKGIDLEKQFEKIQAEEALRRAQDVRSRAEKEKVSKPKVESLRPGIKMPAQDDRGLLEKEESEEEAQDKDDRKEPKGWFGTIVDGITWPFKKAWGWISSLWS